jgi:hypothetical protein
VTVHQLFIDFEKTIQREVLYNILLEFGVLMKNLSSIRLPIQSLTLKHVLDKEHERQRLSNILVNVPFHRRKLSQ